jgi:molybdopterin molybdotransferase
LIRYAEALAIVQDAANKRSLPIESLRISQAVDRIVHQEVQSPEEVPSFDNSAMDGFAIHASELAQASHQAPARLKVAGTILAGDPPPRESNPQVAWEIMTGAPMPLGPQDSVIKIEEVEVIRNSQGAAQEIWVRRPIAREENVRARGEDFKTGQTVLVPGSRLLPEHIMALASLGICSVQVLARPKVAFISTGDEIVDHENHTLRPGMIRNSTAPYLTATAPLYGIDARFYGTVGDSIDEFLSLLNQVRSENPDIILTTGAVSMGKHDFIPDALQKTGATILYHKVAIRPGKPGIFAELPSQDEKPGPVFFGIPGNPISTAVALRFFVWPYLRALQRLAPELPTFASLSQSSQKAEGLRCFFKAHLEADEKGQRVLALKGQPSFMVSPLLAANSWVVFPEDGFSLPAHSKVAVYPLYPHPDRKERVTYE